MHGAGGLDNLNLAELPMSPFAHGDVNGKIQEQSHQQLNSDFTMDPQQRERLSSGQFGHTDPMFAFDDVDWTTDATCDDGDYDMPFAIRTQSAETFEFGSYHDFSAGNNNSNNNYEVNYGSAQNLKSQIKHPNFVVNQCLIPPLLSSFHQDTRQLNAVSNISCTSDLLYYFI